MGKMAQHLDTGFPYSATPDAQVLVLGSMPSRESLARQQYYAHPRNAFWPIMNELFGAGPALPYEQRLRCLRASGVALWDVARQCVRPGSSLDTDIRDVQVNDFRLFFIFHPYIRTIFFNGRTAESLYRKLALPQLEDPCHSLPLCGLPSTSPAHAARSHAQKLAAWQVVKQALEPRIRH